jgi:hypothetical protein
VRKVSTLVAVAAASVVSVSAAFAQCATCNHADPAKVVPFVVAYPCASGTCHHEDPIAKVSPFDVAGPCDNGGCYSDPRSTGSDQPPVPTPYPVMRA